MREEHIVALSIPVGKGDALPSSFPAAEVDCPAGALRGRRLQDHGTREKDGEILTSHTGNFQGVLQMKASLILIRK